MLRALLAVLVVAFPALAQSTRFPFSFDAGLAENPSLVLQKEADLDGRLPAWVHLPADFATLESGPDGVSPPTVTLQLFPELKAQYDRALAAMDAGAPMTWPAPMLCATTAAFALPATLLAAGAPGSCQSLDNALRTTLTPELLGVCLDLEAPERLLLVSRAPAGASEATLRSFVDARTNTLEQQLALAGAGLSLVPPPDGLLPPDWVPTLRKILWKVTPPDPQRTTDARTLFDDLSARVAAAPDCLEPSVLALLQTSLPLLRAEVLAAQAHVDAVVADGITESTQDLLCLQARGRTRPTLPYVGLTDHEREFLAFYLGGLYWRFRGGGYLVLGSTQSNRTFYTRRVFKELARVSSGTPASAHAAEAMFCNLFDGWGSWMDMGTFHSPTAPAEDNQDAYYDLVQMTNRGRQQVADFPLAAYSCYAQGVSLSINKSSEEYLRAANFDTLPLYGAGLSFGPCYLYGLNPLKDFRWYTAAEAPSPYSPVFDGFTTLGEFCVGASLSLGFTRTLLNGTPSGTAPTTLCGARVCGDDGCGNSCGTCVASQACMAGQCVGPMDAGSEPDAGLDAGTPVIDAGAEVDAGTTGLDAGATGFDAGTTGFDAGLDAGALPVDAGLPALDGGVVDGGTDEPGAPGGCGCSSADMVAVALLGVLLRRRAVRAR